MPASLRRTWSILISAVTGGVFMACEEADGFSRNHWQRCGVSCSPFHPSRGSFPMRNAHKAASVLGQREKLTMTSEPPAGASVLSKDPLVFLVPNLLDPDECDAYVDRVLTLSAKHNRTMIRSNPPQVSVDVSKLWPLPLLSLGSCIPPLLRWFESGQPSASLQTILSAVLPLIGVALLVMLVLVVGTVSLIRLFAESSSRTSDAMALNLEQDLDFVQDLVDRVCHVTGHPWYAWEAPVVSRYDPGAIFARHGDASPTRGSEWSELGGQRIVTCICYLNSVSHGGETSFDRLQLAVSPAKGSALIFFPADRGTLVADDRTTHESLPPAEEKWIVQMFGRVTRVPPPLGLPDLYGGS